MSARDKYHYAVRSALTKDGWTITHDPFTLHYETRDTFVDLGAERLLLAEKETQKILVEIKTFLGESQMEALRDAMGQYIIYKDIMEETQAKQTLFMAIPKEAAQGIFAEPIGQMVTRRHKIALIVYDPNTEEIIAWKP